DALPIVAMRLAIVMRYVRKILSGHTDPVRHVVSAAGNHDEAAAALDPGAGHRRGCDDKAFAGLRPHTDNPLAQRDVQAESIGHATVIPKRFLARGFVVRADEWQVTNLHQLRRGEE